MFVMLPIYLPKGEKEYSYTSRSVNPLNVNLSLGVFREYFCLRYGDKSIENIFAG